MDRLAIPPPAAPLLSQVEVLVVDCQATAAAPRGRLLELGWARAGTSIQSVRSSLVALPDGDRVPPAVSRITGITDDMVRAGASVLEVWRALVRDAATLAPQPPPAVIHFARFEQPFLHALAEGAFPLDIVCTHDIARRLLPDLPRRSLRALAGYFGRAVGPLRRSAEHVEATAFVWRELVRLLEAQGVSTWSALRDWLSAPVHAPTRRRRVWPMPREARLALPDAPGVYRLLRTSGDVLYVGKAASLRGRENSNFPKQRHVPGRLLEMLSQARAIAFEATTSALEAALLEPDEIKRHRPPYNVALTVEDRAVWFAPPDLGARSEERSARCPLGPFSSAETLDQFAALVRASPAALARGRWGPDAAVFDAGYALLQAAHPEWSRGDLAESARLLRLGTRLWREGRRDRLAEDDGTAGAGERPASWTPELVQAALELLAVRAALARRRAKWLSRLVDASVAFREPGAGGTRLIVIENGEVVRQAAIDGDPLPPIPPGHRRPLAERRDAFTVARYDRLRVLTSELKRLMAAGAPVALRVGAGPPLAGPRLAAALSWV